MLGTSRVITQSNGAVCYDADFDPFGHEYAYTNTCPQNYKFEGWVSGFVLTNPEIKKERDTETGNDDFGARYYSWRFGRWLSADWSSVPAPVPYANLSNPQTLNLYAMVADDPESFADLDGHAGGCDTHGECVLAGMDIFERLVHEPDSQNVDFVPHGPCINGHCFFLAGNPAQQQNAATATAAAPTVLDKTMEEIDAIVKPLIDSASEDAGAILGGAAKALGVAGLAVDFLLDAPATARDEDMLHKMQNASEHKKGKRESTREKHEAGQGGKARDRGGEKADKRLGRVPRNRPPGHKGPWPPPGTFSQ